MADAQTATPVPMFDPSGVLRDVPYDKTHEALANGMKPGIRVKFPDDSDQVRYVPPDKFMEATHGHHAQVLPIEDQSTDHPGFWQQVGGVVKGMLDAEPIKWAPGGLKGMVSSAPETAGTKLPTDQENAERKAKGYGPTYRALVPAAEVAGVDVPGMEKAADEGDVAGVQARAAVPAALALAHPAGKLAGKVAGLADISVGDVAHAVIHPKAALLGRAVKAMTQAAEDHRAQVEPGAPVYRDATLQPDVNVPEYAGEDYGPNKPDVSQVPSDFTPQRKMFGGRTVPPLPPEELARQDALRAEGRARAAATPPQEPIKSKAFDTASDAPGDAEASPESASEAPVAEKTPETPAVPEKKPLPVRDPKTGRMVKADTALLGKAAVLRQPVHDIVDSVTEPGTVENLHTKSAVEFYLQKGDLDSAQSALDNAKMKSTQETPTTYPSDEPIKAPQEKGLARDPATGRVMNAEKTTKFRATQDRLEDKGINQEMQWGMDKDARRTYRQFIADNSPATKGELTGTEPDMPRWGKENAISPPKSKAPAPIDDLTEILNKSLRQAQLMKEAGASRGAVQEMQAKRLPVGGGTEGPDAMKAESERQFNEDMKKPNVEPFFSKAKWVTDEKIPNATSGDSALATLRNAGVKEGEIKWMGLDDFLKGKAKISRSDIQDFIKEHEIKLGEVDKKSSAGKTKDEWAQEEYGEDYDDLDAGAQHWVDSVHSPGEAKYSQYTLPGEKANYTEKLLTLPGRLSDEMRTNAIDKRMNEINNLPAKAYAGESGKTLMNEWDSLVKERKELLAKQATPFKSGHFDEPNVLAHVRYDDRVDSAGKKTLFLEEVQSDWHQKGKREGYNTPESRTALEKQIADLEQEVKERLKTYSESEGVGTTSGSAYSRYIEAHQNLESLKRQYNATHKGVPDAPFKTDWHELVMKRMLREAAEKGYDKLAWTTGEQQAERYNLAKQVSSIHYFPEENRLMALDHDGNSAIDKVGVKPEQLADYIGKDAAKKLIQAPLQESDEFEHPNQKISGEQLKVGGEWAKRLYDQAIPNFLNKYAKKWGAKVSTTELNAKPELEPLYDDVNEYWIISDKEMAHHLDNQGKLQDSESHSDPMIFDNKKGAQEYVDRVKEIQKDQHSGKVHSIDITPEMKRDVLKKGQPIAKIETPSSSATA